MTRRSRTSKKNLDAAAVGLLITWSTKGLPPLNRNGRKPKIERPAKKMELVEEIIQLSDIEISLRQALSRTTHKSVQMILDKAINDVVCTIGWLKSEKIYNEWPNKANEPDAQSCAGYAWR